MPSTRPYRRSSPILVTLMMTSAALAACAPGGDLAGRTTPIPRRLEQNQPFDTEPMGGDGGDPSTQLTNGIIYAFRGKSDGNFLNQIQFAYYIPSQPGITNEYHASDTLGVYPAVGGDGGTDSGWILCPPNHAAVGFFGRYGQGEPVVNQFKMMCAPVHGLEQPIWDSTTAAVGPSVGEFFNSGSCDEMGLGLGYLSGTKVRTGTLVDQIIGVCRDPDF